MKDPATPFSWLNVGPLLGLPFADSRVRDLFAQAGVDPATAARDFFIGVDAPDADHPPAHATEIDLRPGFHVRLRLRPAGAVRGAAADRPEVLVLSSCTWELEAGASGPGYRGSLPAGILGTDDAAAATQRVGRAPTERRLDPNRKFGSITWEDAIPVLHLVFRMPAQQLLRVDAFLPLADAADNA